MRRHHQPSPATASSSSSIIDAAAQLKRGKKRGNYSCGRCGQPKKGHFCQVSTTSSTTDSTSVVTPVHTFLTPSPPRHPHSHLRRALSFDDNNNSSFPASDTEGYFDDLMEMESDSGGTGLPMTCLWEVLRRLPPASLLSAAKVCKGWRNCTRKLWRAAEELRLRVPPKAQVGLVGSLLQKCSGLVRLSLRMERFGLF